MGCIVKHTEGPASIGAAGYFIFYYKHPQDKPPTMIDMVTGQFETGTSGLCSLWYVDGGGNFHLIDRQGLDATYRYFFHGEHFLLCPGEMLKIMFSNPAAADQVSWAVNGH